MRSGRCRERVWHLLVLVFCAFETWDLGVAGVSICAAVLGQYQ
jgi:hypothetical protein